jgi:hypothetical protein
MSIGNFKDMASSSIDPVYSPIMDRVYHSTGFISHLRACVSIAMSRIKTVTQKAVSMCYAILYVLGVGLCMVVMTVASTILLICAIVSIYPIIHGLTSFGFQRYHVNHLKDSEMEFLRNRSVETCATLLVELNRVQDIRAQHGQQLWNLYDIQRYDWYHTLDNMESQWPGIIEETGSYPMAMIAPKLNPTFLIPYDQSDGLQCLQKRQMYTSFVNPRVVTNYDSRCTGMFCGTPTTVQWHILHYRSHDPLKDYIYYKFMFIEGYEYTIFYDAKRKTPLIMVHGHLPMAD